jgi:hypothetical protein
MGKRLLNCCGQVNNLTLLERKLLIKGVSSGLARYAGCKIGPADCIYCLCDGLGDLSDKVTCAARSGLKLMPPPRPSLGAFRIGVGVKPGIELVFAWRRALGAKLPAMICDT